MTEFNLTVSERNQINEVLRRRANDVATYLDDNRDKLAGSVELALSREIDRLRRLADKVAVPEKEEQ